ncbi:MAG: hypothetical protein A2Y33_02585 [Spirochaetes bacterium GWF1_51_8]|nr:MAG: hypothetical protein A2Y33_02585 [Spirochaetes bacterium GWF1_51_8]
MKERISSYVDEVFAPYENVKSVDELKAELLADLQERYSELKEEGNDDETALSKTIESVGDIEEIVRELTVLSSSLERHVLTDFSGSNLDHSDFKGVTVKSGKFDASVLRGSDFSGAELTGSSFKASDMREADFDNANLTDCSFSTLDLTDASFNKSILVRSEFSMSGMDGAKFTDVKLIDVKLNMTDLRKTIFERCIFSGVVFKFCDLRGLSVDGLTFIGVRFDRSSLNDVSFKGATLKNVSFTPAFALTNKFYRAVKSICFDGALMDKLTYAALRGMEADLSKVTVI